MIGGIKLAHLIMHFLPNVVNLGWWGQSGWGTAIVQTIAMTVIPAFVGGLLGLIFGFGLVLTAPNGITPHHAWFNFFDKVVSLFRSIPFIILLAVIAPFTQLIIGTQIGMAAAMVPLSFSVFPFYARQVQVALESVSYGKVEAAQALGATNRDIIIDVYLWEARSELVRVSTVTIISLIGLTTMAGAIGAGGLGNTAITYGYDRFNNDVTIVATILVLILVLLVQLIGDWLSAKLNHQLAS